MASVKDLLRYEILSTDSSGQEPRPIAEHGMGIVYKAYDSLYDKIVALKIVRDEIFRRQPERARRQFIAEAIAGARLAEKSDHIVRVFDVGQFDDILYMAQEWIHGGNIESQSATVTLYRARRIILQIGEAVQVAHENRIVHSDIAPANILHDEKKDIYKLSDFGLLKLMNKTSIQLTGTGVLMAGGRRDYMPKEHFDDWRLITYSTDVYGLAVTFYVLLMGKLPHKENGSYTSYDPIYIRGEKDRPAPFKLNLVFDEFLFRHKDDHSIEQFLESIIAIPV